MKIFCNYPEKPSGNRSKRKDACGTMIQMGDASEQADLQKAIDKHIADNHGSVEDIHRNVLSSARAAFSRLRDGLTITPKEAQVLLDDVNSLLGLPKSSTEVAASAAVSAQPPVPAASSETPLQKAIREAKEKNAPK
jgi:hypothetical protein